MNDREKDKEELQLAELQVLMSQLRTQLSIMRTGVGVLVGTISIIFLILANQWSISGSLAWLNLPFRAMLGVLIFVGLWRIAVAERKLTVINKKIHTIEQGDKLIDDLVV